MLKQQSLQYTWDFMGTDTYILFFSLLINLLGCLTWFLIAVPFRIFSTSSLYFSATNVCFCLGIALFYYRTEEVSFLTWFLADGLLLCGFVLINLGILKLFKLRVSYIPIILVTGITAIVLMFLQDATYHEALRGIIFLTGAILLLWIAIRTIYIALRKESRPLKMAIVLVPLLVCIILNSSIIYMLLDAPVDEPVFNNTSDYSTELFLWVLVFLCIFVNLALTGVSLIKAQLIILQLKSRDLLTGTFNAKTLAKKVSEAHQEWELQGQIYTLMWIDFTCIRTLLATSERQKADICLVHCAQLMQRTLRKSDSVGRHSMTEFLILLPGMGQQNAMHTAENLLTTFAESPILLDNKIIEIETNFGIITVQPNVDAWSMLHNADAALFKAATAL